MCPYLLAILAVVLGLQPMIEATTGSEAPRSSRRVQVVCLKSWNRLATPAFVFADTQAVLMSPIGMVGSIVLACAFRSFPASP